MTGIENTTEETNDFSLELFTIPDESAFIPPADFKEDEKEEEEDENKTEEVETTEEKEDAVEEASEEQTQDDEIEESDIIPGSDPGYTEKDPHLNSYEKSIMHQEEEHEKESGLLTAASAIVPGIFFADRRYQSQFE